MPPPLGPYHDEHILRAENAWGRPESNQTKHADNLHACLQGSIPFMTLHSRNEAQQ